MPSNRDSPIARRLSSLAVQPISDEDLRGQFNATLQPRLYRDQASKILCRVYRSRFNTKPLHDIRMFLQHKFLAIDEGYETE